MKGTQQALLDKIAADGQLITVGRLGLIYDRAQDDGGDETNNSKGCIARYADNRLHGAAGLSRVGSHSRTVKSTQLAEEVCHQTSLGRPGL